MHVERRILWRDSYYIKCWICGEQVKGCKQHLGIDAWNIENNGDNNRYDIFRLDNTRYFQIVPTSFISYFFPRNSSSFLYEKGLERRETESNEDRPLY